METKYMSVRYVADALMADLTSRHHHLRAASENEAERRMRARYPEAAAILVHEERRGVRSFSVPENRSSDQSSVTKAAALM